jgi:hypothetical protein
VKSFECSNPRSSSIEVFRGEDPNRWKWDSGVGCGGELIWEVCRFVDGYVDRVCGWAFQNNEAEQRNV